MTLDLSNLEDIEPALKDIGDIDLLVNSAGIAYLEEFVNHDIVETEKCVGAQEVGIRFILSKS